MTFEPSLFSSLQLREIVIPNRIAVSPMCTYSASGDGIPWDWHKVHLGSRAAGGAGLVFLEATAVSPDGRITPGCLGLWSEKHIEAYLPITEFISRSGSIPGIQLSHAGRKSGRSLPWEGNSPLQPEQWGPIMAPSAVPYRQDWNTPTAMSEADIFRVVAEFGDAAGRAHQAGFQVLEAHFAHGYLLHQFLSPLANFRSDQFGGSLKNRARFMLLTVRAMREAWPTHLPLFIRLSVIDWAPGGLDLEQTIQVVHWLKEEGVDLIDCSSGAVVPGETVPAKPMYHAEMTREIRTRADIPTGAVGRITRPDEADHLIRSGTADLVLIGRAMLQDPYWPRQAERELQAENPLLIPRPYRRAVEGLEQFKAASSSRM